MTDFEKLSENDDLSGPVGKVLRGTPAVLVGLGVLLVVCFVVWLVVQVTRAAFSQPQGTVLAGCAAGGGALAAAGVAVWQGRRTQDLTRRQIREAARQSGEQLEHAREQLEQQRTEASVQRDLMHQRMDLDRIAELRSRYTEAARQLGDSSAAVRLAGAYAMASLADEWIGNARRLEVTTAGQSAPDPSRNPPDPNAQACIDVLCAYIRTPRPFSGDVADQVTEARADREVRQTIIRITRDHLLPDDFLGGLPVPSWSRYRLDYTGAIFDGEFSFYGAQFDAVALFRDVEFPRGEMSFDGVTFNEFVSFEGARFTGARVSFGAAEFGRAGQNGRPSHSTTSFDGAKFSAGKVSFENAFFRGRSANFREAKFLGSTVDFTTAEFHSRLVSFAAAEVRAGEVTFEAGWSTSRTVTFQDARFVGGSANFGVTISKGRWAFEGPNLKLDPDVAHFGLMEFDEGYVTFTKAAVDPESPSRFPRGKWFGPPPWSPGEQWRWPPVSSEEDPTP